jgi:hypothetical protein
MVHPRLSKPAVELTVHGLTVCIVRRADTEVQNCRNEARS